MKKLLLVLAIGLSLTGCAYLGNQIANVKACYANSECRQEAFAKGKDVGQQAGDLAGLSGLPWAGNAGKAVGSIGGTIAFLAILGAALRKKNEQPTQ